MTDSRPPVEHPPFTLRARRRLLLPDFSGLLVRRHGREPTPRSPKPMEVEPAPEGRRPMYWRLLRLRHIRPNGWLRALFVEGSVGLAVVLVLAEAASIWTIVALPLLVAVLVKANDVIAGALRRPPDLT